MNNQNENINVRFGGGIIGTLSEELPNNSAAFRELIKNAYDASADKISIHLDTKKKTLTIVDDGNGMDKAGMSGLFHLGKSSKKYGSKFVSTRSKENRRIQGAKGIGCLSALHFGDHVEWLSAKADGQGWRAQCDKAALENAEYLDEEEIEVARIDGKSKRGTTIIIALDEYNADKIKECFKDDKQIAKICNVFHNSKIKIDIVVDGNKIACEHVKDFKKKRNNNIFYIKIESTTQSVKIYNGKDVVDIVPIEYDKRNFVINGEIQILDLTDSSTSKTTKLFLNDKGSLTPLIYINDNLFEDYSLFDPEIRRRQSSKSSLPQMIGYIDIVSDSPMLKFTPDRSRMAENSLSDEIKRTLKTINSKVQEIAAKYKHEMGDKLKAGFPIPADDLKAANILIPALITKNTNTSQIALLDLIIEAKDSNGGDIDRKTIRVYVDDELSKTRILPSVTEPCSFTIRYEYDDANTGLTSVATQILFADPGATKIKRVKENLLPYPPLHTNNAYMNVCQTLMAEINELFKCKNDSYKKVIACGLRTVYELPCIALRSEALIPPALKTETSVTSAIPIIIKYFKDNYNDYKHNFEMTYHTVMNHDSKEFEDLFGSSNLGAHASDSHLTHKKIEDIGKNASTFALIVSVMISHALQSNNKI